MTKTKKIIKEVMFLRGRSEKWNLADDNFDNQSEETKLFIGKLLGV